MGHPNWVVVVQGPVDVGALCIFLYKWLEERWCGSGCTGADMPRDCERSQSNGKEKKKGKQSHQGLKYPKKE